MKIRSMARCGICAAAMAVCAWLAVPLGDLAVTMQTFGVFLALGLLGGKLGTAACGVYLLLGAVGLPVFSGFQGGFGVLLGPTGGFLWGFFAAAILYWLLENRLPKWLSMGLGMLLCYACGSVWYYFLYAGMGIHLILLKCVVPYLIPDGIKITLALLLAGKIRRNAHK